MRFSRVIVPYQDRDHRRFRRTIATKDSNSVLYLPRVRRGFHRFAQPASSISPNLHRSSKVLQESGKGRDPPERKRRTCISPPPQPRSGGTGELGTAVPGVGVETLKNPISPERDGTASPPIQKAPARKLKNTCPGRERRSVQARTSTSLADNSAQESHPSIPEDRDCAQQIPPSQSRPCAPCARGSGRSKRG
jgi:hypothetical protein